ncbi:AAA family ATPase [Candidatus Altiarchaeota archaeon]
MNVIFVTGAPGSGKTSVSSELAKELSIHQLIGTDTIREILRNSVSKEDCPTLHTSAILCCDQTPSGEDEMIWGFEKQALDVKPGIEAVVKRSIKEGKDLILEGIHLIPGLVQLEDENVSFIHVVLSVASEDQHLKQLTGQGESRSSYKIENFKKARAFQEYLVEKAKEHGALVVDNDSINQIVAIIKQQLIR